MGLIGNPGTNRQPHGQRLPARGPNRQEHGGVGVYDLVQCHLEAAGGDHDPAGVLRHRYRLRGPGRGYDGAGPVAHCRGLYAASDPGGLDCDPKR